jgi:two-component system nitrogen regulation response regulator GlnG
MNGEAVRVWLVDDDASIRWVLERALKHGGMSARVFDAAEPALEALRREAPDVLITDIRVPRGWSCCAASATRARRCRSSS